MELVLESELKEWWLWDEMTDSGSELGVAETDNFVWKDADCELKESPITANSWSYSKDHVQAVAI